LGACSSDSDSVDSGVVSVSMRASFPTASS
jgi:hypothetical protein